MKLFFILIVSFAIFYGCNIKNENLGEIPSHPFARIKEINWTDVEWTDGFWGEKFNLCREEIIPAVYNGFMDTKNADHLDNFKIAAGLQQGEYKGDDWSDGDSYKWIESLAFMYAVTKDKRIDSTMDYWITVIAKAQLNDGYISTNMQLRNLKPYMQFPNPDEYGGAYHELYNQGHLLTAACIHYRATGKKNFLKVAVKLADHLCEVFKPGVPELRVMAGNLPNIMGLVDIYRITGEMRYLNAAKLVVNLKGFLPGENDLTQDHVPFREENEAVGHCVFATYLYAGVADVIAESGDWSLFIALDRVWQSAEMHRAYITGGIGSMRKSLSSRGDNVHEAFGTDYQLPNRIAYNETCANIGNAMWNWRMLLLTGDAKYTDYIEIVLYNSMLSGVSSDGKKFFYANPLEFDPDKSEGLSRQHTAQRWPVFSCYCCPPQVARTIAGLGRWLYSVSDDTLWIHLYGSNTLQTKLPDGSEIKLRQETDYPWSGKIRIGLNKVPEKSMTVMVRIPGWNEHASLKINQQDIIDSLKSCSYFAISRKWLEGDNIELNLTMPVRFMEANPKVEDCRNKIAVMRGPIVYCVEYPVSEFGRVRNDDVLYLPGNAVFKPRMENRIGGGVVVLEGKGLTNNGRDQFIDQNPWHDQDLKPEPWGDQLYRKFTSYENNPAVFGTVDLTLIPYFSWANNGPAVMKVWIPLAR